MFSIFAGRCCNRVALVASAFVFTAGFVVACPRAGGQDKPLVPDPPPSDAASLMVVGECMGPIEYQVTVDDPPNSIDEDRLQQQVQVVLDRVNQRMSTYIDDSDISRFNASKSTEFIPCEAETARVIDRAIQISELTGGAFDVTVGPAVEVWGFGRSPHRPWQKYKVPTDQAVADALAKIGYQKLSVRLDPPAIKKTTPDVQINLSAIAKGYAVDQVAQSLIESKCDNFMIEVGGEVRAQGHRVDGRAWRVGVKRPTQPRPGVQPAIEAVALISDGAMATSGDYANFGRVGKTRYSHTINPLTARPVEHHLASACVLAGDCMTADALATAAMVMGLPAARQLIIDQGHEFHLIQQTGDFSGRYHQYASDSFPFANESDRNKLSPWKVDAAKDPADTKTNADSDSLSKTVAVDGARQRPIWPVFLGAFCVFALMVVAMAVGAIFNNKPVTGSCGGLANMTNEDGETSCGICSKPVTDCQQWADAQPADAIAAETK